MRHNDMCFMNILYYAESGVSTKNPIIRGKCTHDQTNSFPADSTQPLPENRILTQHAINGNGKGIIHITDTTSVNLVINIPYLNEYYLLHITGMM